MTTAMKPTCIDPKSGRLLRDALADELWGEGREKDRSIFFEHIEACEYCRGALLDHAAEVAIDEVAAQRNVSVADVEEEMSRAFERLQESAAREGVSLKEALKHSLNAADGLPRIPRQAHGLLR